MAGLSRAAMERSGLRLLTTNLFNRNGSAQALEQLLQAQRPDVVFAQELAPAQAEVLERHYEHGRLMPRADTLGMGIASRIEMEVEALPMPRRYFLKARLSAGQAGGLPVELINVHLSCPDRVEAFAERREQVKRLSDYVKAVPGMRRVIAGDFNTMPSMPAYRQLRRTFDDAALQAARASGAPARATWGPRPDGPRLCRIDHIFVQGFNAQRVDVLSLTGSDHDALCASLALG